jgi:hypothetical protein
LHRSLLLAGAGVIGTSMTAKAKTKMAQNLVHFQTFPKDGHSCATCEFFEPPNACKVVEGPITGADWCDLWVKKS